MVFGKCKCRIWCMLKLLVIAWFMFYGPQHLYETEHIICLCFSYAFWLCLPWPLLNPRSQVNFCQHFNTYSSLLKFSLFFIYDRDWYFKFPIRWTMKHLFSNKHMWALLLMLWWGRYLRSLSDPQLRKHDFLAWMNSHFSFFTKPQFVQMIRC